MMILLKADIRFTRTKINAFVNENIKTIAEILEYESYPIYDHDYSSYVFPMLNQLIQTIQAEDMESAHEYAKLLLHEKPTCHFYDLIPIQTINSTQKQSLLLSCNAIPDEYLTREFTNKTYAYSFEKLQIHFQQAIDLIQIAVPDLYFEMSQFVKEIFILNQRPPKQGSNISIFGALFFSQDVLMVSAIDAYERIIHEAAHMFLYANMFNDPLVENNLDAKYKHGLREDLRPMIAIYHACFVLGRIIYGLTHLIECYNNHALSLKKDEISRANELLKTYKEKLSFSLKSLKSDATLTSLGTHLITPIFQLDESI